jgi:general secretion pathway protein B
MSLILDALRKSEAERRRGQSPSLYADMPAPTTPLRPAWIPWLPVAGGILLLVAVAVYFTRDNDAPVTKQELVEDPNKSLVTAPPVADEAVEIVPAPEPASAANAPPLSPPPTAHAPAPGKNPASVDALVPSPANPVAAAADAALNSTPAASVGAPPLPAPATAPAAASEAPVDEVPPVAVLDPSTRGALPPLKLSMHVYNPDPARRFAIIDGQRVTDGAQLGAAIVLEIRRDGVVMDVSGRRVLLPRP